MEDSFKAQYECQIHAQDQYGVFVIVTQFCSRASGGIQELVVSLSAFTEADQCLC